MEKKTMKIKKLIEIKNEILKLGYTEEDILRDFKKLNPYLGSTNRDIVFLLEHFDEGAVSEVFRKEIGILLQQAIFFSVA
jgi:hypothetical protein